MVGHAASRPDCLPSPPCGLAWLAAFGDVAPAYAVRLVGTRRKHARFRFRLAGAGLPVTCFRTSPSSCVCASVTATARASGSVLRITAFSSVCPDRHSIAVAAPTRETRPRRFPLAHTWNLSFLTACRGFGSHTRRTVVPDVPCLRPGALPCPVRAPRTPSHHGKGDTGLRRCRVPGRMWVRTPPPLRFGPSGDTVFASAEWHLWPEAGFRPGSAGRIRQLRAFPNRAAGPGTAFSRLKTTNTELALLLGRSDTHTKLGSAN